MLTSRFGLMVILGAAVLGGVGLYFLLGEKTSSVSQSKEPSIRFKTVDAIPLEVVVPQAKEGQVEVELLADAKEEEQGLVDQPVPEVDRISELFLLNTKSFPFVETVTYSSRVDWQKGRPAWLSDYASHYKTSRHFIARSLNGRVDYLKQDVKDGDRFNVLTLKGDLSFELVLDLKRTRLFLFSNYNGDRQLVKTYTASVGRKDIGRNSGFLTPKGKYLLGDRIATYPQKVMGYYQGQKVEMIRIFGTRWIPFEEEIGECSAPAKGYGLHGVPWIEDPETGLLVEDSSSIGQYDSDGCVRLATKDIEELYAVIVSRPTTIEIVDDFYTSECSHVYSCP